MTAAGGFWLLPNLVGFRDGAAALMGLVGGGEIVCGLVRRRGMRQGKEWFHFPELSRPRALLSVWPLVLPFFLPPFRDWRSPD